MMSSERGAMLIARAALACEMADQTPTFQQSGGMLTVPERIDLRLASGTFQRQVRWPVG